MPLSAQQVTMYQGQALRARNGDPQAQHFFSEIAREQMPGWQDIYGIYEALAGAAGAVAAQAFAGGAPGAGAPGSSVGGPGPYSAGSPPPVVPSGLGGILDAPFLQRMQMSAQQLKDNTKMTLLYAQGDADAITYFNGCAGGALAGSVYSSRAIQLRDKILCSPQFGWTRSGNGIVPPATPVEEAPFEVTQVPDAAAGGAGAGGAAPPVHAQAFAQVYDPPAQPSQGQGGNVSGPVARRLAQEAIAERNRREAEVAAAKAGGPPPQHVAPPAPYVAPAQPQAAAHAVPPPASPSPGVLISSGVVQRVPTFDMPGAIEVIQAAIDENRIFGAAAVQVLLREVVQLRSRVAQAASNAPREAQAPAPQAPAAPNGTATV
jgi:hypothetical protein